MTPINANLAWLLLGTFAALSVGTGVRLIELRNSAAEVAKKRMGSLKVWWVLALLWSAAAVFGLAGATILFAITSFIGLREYLKLIGTKEEIGGAAIGSLMALGTAHYALIGFGFFDLARVFLPIAALLLFGAIRETTCETENYIRSTAGLYWGAMLMIYALSHALFLFDVDPILEPMVGAAGGFLFLVLLTEMNDIMQAVVGRKFGKHKITPLVSPNKSIEGLLGGVCTTVVLAICLAPYLTTLTTARTFGGGILVSVLAGVAISLSGFLGDINMSAIKRDVGVKDGSAILPGMGGLIDRIDSLIFTAPVFYYFVVATEILKA